ncbi:hypothetical protein KDA23_03660 [Candidatus Saccharibacteria bacterium]|nr:hypothetical protein [Candidatus Saccharibacteria bacterium]
MSPDLLFILLIAVPVVVLMLLRVNAALVFLSACLGAVLLKYVGPDIADFMDMFLPAVNVNYVNMGVLLLPPVLTTVFMIKTVNGMKLAFNLLPAAGTGFLLALLLVPLLSDTLAGEVQATDVWHTMEQLQSLVIGLSALVCLFFLWLQRPKHHKGKLGKHGKHH